jgi:hypothetical protein
MRTSHNWSSTEHDPPRCVTIGCINGAAVGDLCWECRACEDLIAGCDAPVEDPAFRAWVRRE